MYKTLALPRNSGVWDLSSKHEAWANPGLCVCVCVQNEVHTTYRHIHTLYYDYFEITTIIIVIIIFVIIIIQQLQDVMGKNLLK